MRLWSIPACVRTFLAALASAGPEAHSLTLGQLRADLSHEMAAKIARLSGILEEWRAGAFQENDLADTMIILADIDNLHLRHSRIAVATTSGFAQLTRVVSTIAHLRAACARAAHARDSGPDAVAAAVAAAAALLRDLGRESRSLVEALSCRYAVRFGDLVTRAVDEIRHEFAVGQDVGVPMVVDNADSGVPTWVPRADAATWVDIMRNLVRNAIQAVQERDDRHPGAADDNARSVTIRMRPVHGRGCACVEIVDDGVGMDAIQLDAMWHDGEGRHGDGHGHGLTRNKRMFMEERAGLEVRSIPGVGTSIRIELHASDITVRMPRRWTSPPIAVPAVLVCFVALGAAWQFRHLDMVSVSVTDERLVQAVDSRGRVIWHRSMPERVMPNYRSIVMTEQPSRNAATPQLVTVDDSNRPIAVLSTLADRGPGRVVALDRSGDMRWEYALAWTAPGTVREGSLISAFQAETIWNPDGRRAVVINVRDRNWSSTSIQFLDMRGGRLGDEYLHPGHVEFVASADFDGDGRTEILLNGKNNDAGHHTEFWPGENVAGAYVECLILLENPVVGGQAFPYRRWAGIGPAHEEAYLLIPPLAAASFADPKLTQITRLATGRTTVGNGPCIEISIADGRIYRLDKRLRPLSCSIGDHTPASDSAVTAPATSLMYFHEGQLEKIDLPIHGGAR